jgi:hypothetical protein
MRNRMYHRAAPPITAVVAVGLAWISVLIFHQKVQFLESSFLREKWTCGNTKLSGYGCIIGGCVSGSSSTFEPVD